MNSFYSNITSEFSKEIDDTELRKSARDLSLYHRSSNKGDISSPDYNNPALCCAYIYKYAPLHTRMVTKYFRKMWNKKEVKNIFLCNNRIKVCCLGGGPGIEFVGICTALAVSPSMHNKVRKVSVLDKCNGWEPFFKSIMSSLVDSKDKMLPETFFRKTLRKEFVQVDFQDPLPDRARQVISQADVICMMKFLSEFSLEKSACISQVLGKLFKKDAVVLYIDELEENSIKRVDYISKSSDFKLIIGPLEEKFINGIPSIQSNVEKFGCNQYTFGKISVIGWKKTQKVTGVNYNDSFSASYSSLSDMGSIEIGNEVIDSDIGSEAMNFDLGRENMYSDLESEAMDCDLGSEALDYDLGSEARYCDPNKKNTDSGELKNCDIMNLNKECGNMACTKYTQTEDYLSVNDRLKSETQVELDALLEALANLVTVIERCSWKKRSDFF